MFANKIISRFEFRQKYPIYLWKALYSSSKETMVYEISSLNAIIKTGPYRELVNDMSFLSQIIHPNIIEIQYIAVDGPDNISIAFPKGIPLNVYLPRNVDKIPVFFREIIDAVKFLHDNYIVHCDIKVDNIVVINDHPILIDFGLTTFAFNLDGKICFNENCGSTGYASPFHPWDIKDISAELFCLGKTLLCAYTNQAMYSSNISPLTFEDEELGQVVNSLIKENPLSLEEVLELPYFIANPHTYPAPVGCIKQETILKTPESLLDEDTYLSEMPWFLQQVKNIIVDACDLFLILHNIHRTKHLFSIFDKSHFKLFLSIHIFLVCSNYTEYPTGLSVYSKGEVNSLFNAIITEMNGIVLTQTAWYELSSKQDFIVQLRRALDYHYIFVPRIHSLNCSFNRYISMPLVLAKIIGQNDLSLFIEGKFTISETDIQLLENKVKYKILTNIDAMDSNAISVIYHYTKFPAKFCIPEPNYIAFRLLGTRVFGIYDIVFGREKHSFLRKHINSISSWKQNVFLSSLEELETNVK